jgi:hypothetical protein
MTLGELAIFKTPSLSKLYSLTWINTFQLSRYSDWLRAGRPGGAGVRIPVG